MFSSSDIHRPLGQCSKSDRLYPKLVAEFGIIHEVYTRVTRTWNLEPRFQKAREIVAKFDSLRRTPKLVLHEAVKM